MNRKELNKQLEAQLKSLDPILRDPKKLRIAVLGLMILIAVGLVYMPLKRGIRDRERALKQEEERVRLSREIQLLEVNLARYRSQLPESADVNYWSEHLMNGMRQESLLLRSFEPKEQDRARVGQYTGLVIKMEVEGRFLPILRYLARLEYDEVFLRVAKIRMDDNNGTLVAAITVAVLTNRAKPKPKAPVEATKVAEAAEAAPGLEQVPNGKVGAVEAAAVAEPAAPTVEAATALPTATQPAPAAGADPTEKGTTSDGS